MDKKTLLIFFLFFLFLLLFQYMFHPTPPPKKEKKSITTTPSPLSPLNEEANLEKSHRVKWIEKWGKVEVSDWGGVSSFTAEKFHERRKYALKIIEGERKRIKNSLHSSSNKTLLSYQLTKLNRTYKYFKNSLNKGVELISFPEIFWAHLPPYFIYTNLRGSPFIFDGPEHPYKIRKENGQAILEKEKKGIKVVKEILPSSHPYLTKFRINLVSNSPLPPGKIRISLGPDVGYKEGGRMYAFHGPVGYLDGKYRKISFPRRKKGKSEIEKYGKVGWVAIQNDYFTQVIIPETSPDTSFFSRDKYGEYSCGIEWEIPPGNRVRNKSFEFELYIGPKKIESLKAVGKNVELLVDLGYFGNLFRVIYILNGLYHVTHNYGWAIVILTIIINVILYPFSWKSFRSMNAMQKLAPQIEEIKKKFRDQPQRLNKEIMALYRKEGVSPLGGCLPMLFQIPVFFALFTTLRSAIELRGAPFIGWIHDLSLPDTLFTIRGFPFHLLPIFMGVTTFFQQKLTGSQTQNPLMSSFMPIFLTFIFYNFPSGLVLYWFINSVLSIIEQKWQLRVPETNEGKRKSGR